MFGGRARTDRVSGGDGERVAAAVVESFYGGGGGGWVAVDRGRGLGFAADVGGDRVAGNGAAAVAGRRAPCHGGGSLFAGSAHARGRRRRGERCDAARGFGGGAVAVGVECLHGEGVG